MLALCNDTVSYSMKLCGMTASLRHILYILYDTLYLKKQSAA